MSQDIGFSKQAPGAPAAVAPLAPTFNASMMRDAAVGAVISIGLGFVLLGIQASLFPDVNLNQWMINVIANLAGDAGLYIKAVLGIPITSDSTSPFYMLQFIYAAFMSFPSTLAWLIGGFLVAFLRIRAGRDEGNLKPGWDTYWYALISIEIPLAVFGITFLITSIVPGAMMISAFSGSLILYFLLFFLMPMFWLGLIFSLLGSVLGSIVAYNHTEYLSLPYKMESYEYNTQNEYQAVSPEVGGIQSSGLLLFTIIGAFIVLFLLFAITKGTVKINRSDFLGRENVSRNVKEFIGKVEQLGGKVSVQNAESLIIRSFRTEGKIDKSSDVEKRSKTYVENQKLLVTLQSRASRAYVAQKFKDCISAIEKMIQIARRLEDQTLVQNYEENLTKVIRLLRRKGISVSSKVRVDEAAAPGEEMEQLSMHKKELVDLQNRASKAFAERNFVEAKESIKAMLAIAKKIQDPVLIRNYEANLRKIIAMEKGGSV